jgi:cardiolipin synthase
MLIPASKKMFVTLLLIFQLLGLGSSIHAGIEQAESYILFLFYIIRADNTGAKFKEQLIRKARDGLAVYILYDELGSSGLDAGWISEFTAAGIRMIPFNTRQGPQNRLQFNFRNHRKIVVVDGKAAWIGGLNIGDDYLGLDRKLTPWRDTHLRINGPAALAAQAIFVSDWHWASKEFLRGLSWHPQPAVSQAGDGKKVLIFGSGPADDIETASLFFTNALNISRQRIWIATPYFIPDEATMVALKLALLKGIDVRIITPAMNDNWFVRHAANVYLSKLSRLGARVYSYQKGFLHQKVMLIDDKYALVGTVNFDNRSFRLNFEITGLVADPDFNRQLETMLLNDLSNSIEVPAAVLENQSLFEQLKARGSALLAPVL